MVLIDVDIYQISSGDIIKFDDNQVKFMVDNRGNFVKIIFTYFQIGI